MTNEHKDLPALPKEDMTLNLLPGEPIQSRRRYTANQMTSYGIHCADSALAARPEPAGAGVEGIDTQDFKAKLSDYNVGMVSVVGLIAYIDAHVAAQVAKARLTPRVKDHVLAAVVNKLRDTAIQFHAAGQLRQRLREAISPLIGGIETTPQAQQPVASGGLKLCKFCDGAGKQFELVDEASTSMTEFKCAHCSGTGLAKNYPPAAAPDAGARDARIRVGTFRWNGISRPQVWFDDVPLFGEESMTSPEADHVEAFGKYIEALIKSAQVPDAGARDVFAQFEVLRKIPKVPGYCCGTKHTEYEAFELAIRAIKTTPAKPAQDLVAAIEALTFVKPRTKQEDGYNIGIIAAAALVAAHLKGTT